MFAKLLDSATATGDKFLLKTDRKIYRFLLGFSKNKRPSSYPYVTGDSFRALANHIYDESVKLNPRLVRDGEIVFVGQDVLRTYLEEVHPQISSRYVLICHNGDSPVDEEVTNMIDEKIIHFFAQDVTVAHPRVTPIPIGIENKHYHVNGVTPMFDRLRKKIERRPPSRKNRIFYNFSISTNPPERTKAKELFARHPQMDTTTKFLSPRMHAYTLMGYKFVASPPGHAIESCRTWEALYFKTVPIVKDFVAMRYFRDVGLPIWIVNDWIELNSYTDTMLAAKYEELMTGACFDALFMDFWITKIHEQQKLTT